MDSGEDPKGGKEPLLHQLGSEEDDNDLDLEQFSQQQPDHEPTPSLHERRSSEGNAVPDLTVTKQQPASATCFEPISTKCIERGQGYVLVMPVLFLEFLAQGIAIGVLPKLSTDFFGRDAVFITSMFGTGKGLLSFFASPIAGILSDRMGRRRVILGSAVGTSLAVCSLLFHRDLWLFCSLDALGGMFNCTHAVVYAYIADVMGGGRGGDGRDGGARAKGFGRANATFGASLVLGPIVGASIFALTKGYTTVFFLINMLTLLNALYIIFLLPESLAVSESLGDIRKTDLNPFTGLSVLWSNPMITRLAVVAGCYFMSLSGLVSTLLMYLTARWGFSVVELASFLTVFGVLEMVSSGYVVGVVVPRFGERQVMMVAMLGQAIIMILFGVALSKAMLFFALTFSIVTPLTLPAVLSLASHHAHSAEQGKVQGAINSLRAVCSGVAPAFFGTLLRLSQDTPLPGLPYVIGSIFGFIGLFAAYSLPLSASTRHDALSASISISPLTEGKKLLGGERRVGGSSRSVGHSRKFSYSLDFDDEFEQTGLLSPDHDRVMAFGHFRDKQPPS